MLDRTWPLVFGAGLALAVSACSSSNASTTTTAGAATTTAAVAGPAVPTTAGGPAATVLDYFAGIGLTLTAAESSCLAGQLDADTVASLADSVENGSEPTDDATLDVFGGLVTCQPKAYVDSQVQLIVQSGGATETQATCVITKADALFRSDQSLLELAAGDAGAQNWPAVERDKLRAAIAPCVPPAIIDKILDSV